MYWYNTAKYVTTANDARREAPSVYKDRNDVLSV